MSFEDFSLCPQLISAITKAGYSKPTPIQQQAIPVVLEGKDICGSAQTGTGKTAAFVLPLLHRLSAHAGKYPRALILAPTRELAMQITAEINKYCVNLPQIKTVCIYGGAPYPIQNRQLSRPFDILVATPGRLIDHFERGRINFSQIEMFILDEADRMLDMGFIGPVEQIAESLPKKHQTLLFSATLKKSVLKLAQKLLHNPVEIQITPEKTKHENIEQRLCFVKNIDEKYRLLDEILADVSINQAIIFTATKRQTELLSNLLQDNGHKAGALHGDMHQKKRTHTIGLLRQGKIRLLVATDVAARGIDVLTISHVINFDIAGSGEDHVHRIGRTGRASTKGVALSFVASKDIPTVREIEKYTGQKMMAHKPSDELAREPQRAPKKHGGAPRHRNRRRFHRSSRDS